MSQQSGPVSQQGKPVGQAERPAAQALEPSRPDETEAERDDRNLIELLQELRVVGLGVQVLFGFLLALPFTSRFAGLWFALPLGRRAWFPS